MIPFDDRADGGQQLAEQLQDYADRSDVVVIALPRGGVVTGYEVAKRLHAPLDVTCPKKIGAPGNPEYAIGAVTESGDALFDEAIVAHFGLSEADIEQAALDRQRLAQERLSLYRQGRSPVDLKGRTVLIVDDGLATGFTMKAAIVSIRKQHPSRIVVAVPVAPAKTVREIQPLVDDVVCLEQPSDFYAVGQFYRFFDQTDDAEVIQLLGK